MSSTQWGRKTTLWAEEHMAGLRLAAVATAGVVVISPYLLLVGIKRSLTNRTSHSSFNLALELCSAALRGVFLTFAICPHGFFFVCPPTHPDMGFACVRRGGGLSVVNGSGERGTGTGLWPDAGLSARARS